MSALAWAALCALALGVLIAWAFCAIRHELRRVGTRLRMIADEQAKLSADQRGMRQQLANLLGMLLRAGFKRGPARDWSDDEQATQAHGESTDTKWDWRRPDDG